jgi:integrase
MSLNFLKTWREGIEQYTVYSQLHHAPPVQRDVAYVLRKFGEHVAGRPPQDVKRFDVEGYQARIASAGSSPANTNRHVRILRTFFRWLIDGEMLESNPCKRIRDLRVIRRRRPSIPRADLDRLLVHLDGTGDRLYAGLTRLIANTGLRLGEAVHLKTEDVDFERRILLVRCREEYVTKDREERSIPLNEVALGVLRDRLETATERWLWRVGKRLPNLSGLTHGIAARARAAGLQGVNWYQLRHSFATRSAETMTPTQLAAIMGHWDPRTTRKFYIHCDEMLLPKPPEIG